MWTRVPQEGDGLAKTQAYQPAPVEDIFLSDDEIEEEEEEEDKTELCSRLMMENSALRLENQSFELRLRTERRMYQEYQEELRRENLKLEMKSGDLDRDLQKLKSDLQEKEDERIEAIKELNKLAVTSSVNTDGKKVKGK